MSKIDEINEPNLLNEINKVNAIDPELEDDNESNINQLSIAQKQDKLCSLNFDSIQQSSKNIKKKTDECIELKNLKYKSLLIKGRGTNKFEEKNSSSITNIDKFLDNERSSNKIDNWIKLDKTEKLERLLKYAKKFCLENNFTLDIEDKLILFFKDCLDKKKLQKSKDVKYNRKDNEIEAIPGLGFNSNSNNFTIKNTNPKLISTVKMLTPRKKIPNNITIKHHSHLDDNDNINFDEDND